MASVIGSIAGSGPVTWNDTGRTWRLGDLFSSPPRARRTLTITSTAPFIVPTHASLRDPSDDLQVGFTIDITKAPSRGWRASNVFMLTITLDDGFGAPASTTLAERLFVVGTPLISSPLMDRTLPVGVTDTYIAHLPSVFSPRYRRAGSTLAYAVRSTTGGLTAGIDAGGDLRVTTPATAGTGRVTVRCTATSAAGAPASLTAMIDDTFVVESVAGEQATLTGSIPQQYIRQDETLLFDVLDYFDGDAVRIESVSAPGTLLDIVNLGSSLSITAGTPQGNKQDALVSVSVIADEGDAISSSFTVSVLASSVRFDPGTPSASVNASRLMSVSLPIQSLRPNPPYAGAVLSYQIEATNRNTAILKRTTTLPTTIQLDDGGSWQVRARMFLDGFPSHNTRSIFVQAPYPATGQIIVSSGTELIIQFDYGVAASQIEDVQVDLYGDQHHHYGNLIPTTRAQGVVVSIIPPAGIYEMHVSASVNGLAVSYRQSVVFGSPVEEQALGSEVKMDGIHLPVERASFDAGIKRAVGGLGRMWSTRGSVRLYSDRPLDDFADRRITFHIGQRLVASTWVHSAREVLGARREVRLDLEGRLEHSGGRVVDYAARLVRQGDALLAICEQAGVPCIVHESRASIPVTKMTETLARAIGDLETYGTIIYEDRFGRLAQGRKPTLPVSLRQGVDGPTTAAAEDITTPPTTAGFNAVDAPAQTVEQSSMIVSDMLNGDGIGLEVTIWEGFDLSQYLPDVDTLTMRRTGTKATITPATPGIRLVGRRWEPYRGPDRISYEVDRTRDRNDLLVSDLPRYADSSAVTLARVIDLLGRDGRDRRITASVVAPYGSTRLGVISQIEMGSTIDAFGTAYLVEGIAMRLDRGEVEARFTLNPHDAGMIVPTDSLHYDQNQRYDGDRKWA